MEILLPLAINAPRPVAEVGAAECSIWSWFLTYVCTYVYQHQLGSLLKIHMPVSTLETESEYPEHHVRRHVYIYLTLIASF